MYQNIVLHLPHCSAKVPEYLEKQNPSAIRTLRSKSFYLVDYHTHSLFLPDKPHPLISSIMAPYLRTLVDMERMPDDPLESKGFGIVSQWAIDGLGEEFRKQALHWHLEYHRSAMLKLNALKKPLLIDCHSFSSHPTPLCECPPNVDICIGWNEDKTTPDRLLLGVIVAYFMDLGYSIGLNNPFSNSKTFPGATDYCSFMIEINKRCYMDEETLKPTANFAPLHNQILHLYDILLDYK
jgi:N-formylglutamate amidohydrolase